MSQPPISTYPPNGAPALRAVPSPAGARLEALLDEAVGVEASDLHLVSDAPPLLRVDGDLAPRGPVAPVADRELAEMIAGLLSADQRHRLLHEGEVDFSHQSRDGDVFRMNAYRHARGLGLAVRVIPTHLRSLDELGMPAVIRSLAGLPRGLVLVTGMTGSGKSTTLAALVDEVNRTRSCHILTVEDPIEYRHRSQRAVVTQREVGQHSPSFSSALRHALRQDPDVILIGEMRDAETIQTALTAAETGHLVFATLHAQDCPQALDRIIDVFPSEQQDQVRAQLAAALQAVVAQVLCRRAGGAGRVAAVEVMVATLAVRAHLREGKQHQLYSVMHSGRADGMCTLDQSLADLVLRRVITFEGGLAHCRMVEEYTRLCGRSTRTVDRAAAARESVRFIGGQP